MDNNKLIADIRYINPQMIFILVCYSQTLDLRFLLERVGVLAEVRVNRDLCVLSRGKILTMSSTQREFLQIMAQPENIVKKVVQIEGQVGSGKTLLGIEVLKMKVAHYLRFHGLTAQQGKEKIRVIIAIALGTSKDLTTHLERELSDDIGKHAELEIQNINLGRNDLKEIIETPNDFANFKQTIILVDECYIGDMDNYTVKNLEEKLEMDYIHCIRYEDLGKNYKVLEEEVKVGEETVSVTLLKRQRSSQPILDFSYFMKSHEKYPSTIPDIPNSHDSFPGPKPQWANVKDPKAFVKYAEEKLFKFKGEAMIIIYEDEEKLPEISSLCSKLDWRYCYKYEVRGSESSLVIIYDFPYFWFEPFTRAKHNLLIVTLSGKR